MLWLAAQLTLGMATVGAPGLRFRQQKKGHPGPQRRGFPSLHPFSEPCGRAVADHGIPGAVQPFWSSVELCPWYKVLERWGVGCASPCQGPCLPLVPVQEAGGAEPQLPLPSVPRVTGSVLLLSSSGDLFRAAGVPSPFSKPLLRWHLG